MDKKEMILNDKERIFFMGGVRSVIIFLKNDDVVDENEADSARFLVFDKDDNIIYESYGSLNDK